MKKRIFCAVIAAMLIILMLPIQAFAAETIDEVYVGREFDRVIGTAPNATKFSYSGKVPTGLKLSGTYAMSNKYGSEILSVRLSGVPTEAGTFDFTVTCKSADGKSSTTLSYRIVVGSDAPFDRFDPKTFSIDSWPNKTTYYLGDTVDTRGLKVTATVYKQIDDSSKYEVIENYDITDLCYCNPTIFTFDEAQNVEVFVTLPNMNGELETVSDTFRVDFKYADANTVMKVELLAKPTKLTYTVGDELDTEGLTLRVTKGDGSTEEITEGFTCDVETLDEVGTETVTVTYGEKTATFEVTVTEVVAASEPESSSESSSAPESSASEETSSAPEETSSAAEEETSSEPESSASEETSSVVEEETSSEPETESSEPEEDVVSTDVEPEEKGGVPFWAWIIIGFLVVAVGAAVGLFLIGRKNMDE